MVRRLSAAEWKRRENRIHALLRSRKVTRENVRTILYGRHQPPGEVERRIKIMDAHGVKLGVTHALGCSREKFESLIQKELAVGWAKMTPARYSLVELMESRGISEKTAILVLERSIKTKPINVAERLRVLTQTLDFKRYGITVIPPLHMDKLIVQLPFDKMRSSLRAFLRDTENRNAERILDKVMPFWRRRPTLSAGVETRVFLEKWLFLVNKGIEPSAHLLKTYSLKTLKEKNVQGNRLDPHSRKNLLDRYAATVKEGLDKIPQLNASEEDLAQRVA